MKIRQYKTKLNEEPPDQLEIRNGVLVGIDGSQPDFEAMPDGKFNLISREEFQWYRQMTLLATSWAS
jgi:hypothetical protein